MRLLAFWLGLQFGALAQTPTPYMLPVWTGYQYVYLKLGPNFVTGKGVIDVLPSPQNEGQWCPMAVFTRTTDKLLTFTKDAAPGRSCYLHATGILTSGITVQEWTHPATVTIAPDSLVDDVVYFYWIDATLHISGRTASYACDGCTVDSARIVDTFPANALVAGLYRVEAGIWAASGHPVVNEHQILSTDPMTVTYTPNVGYTFQFDTPTAAALARQSVAIASQVDSAQVAIRQLNAAKTIGLDEIRTAASATAKTTPKGLHERIAALENAHAAASFPTAQEVETVRNQLAQAQMQLQLQTQQHHVMGMMRHIQPPTAPGPCPSGVYSYDAQYLYLCPDSTWVRSALDATWK